MRLLRAFLAVFVVVVGCERSSDRPPRYPPPGPMPPPAAGMPPANAPPPDGPPRSNDDLVRVVNGSYPKFTSCYQYSESYMTGKSGSATIFFDVAPAGHVTRATSQPPPGFALPADTLADAKLHDCLVRGFYELRFAPSREESAASFTFPFSR